MKLKVNQHYTLPSDLDYLLNINVTTVDSGWNFNKFKKKKVYNDSRQSLDETTAAVEFGYF